MALKNPLQGTKPATVGLFLLTCLWAVFQWRDPTPPPVLDQILVASFGVWFANEAIDRKNKDAPRRTITTNSDGSITVAEDDEDPEPPPDRRSG
ncbi:hypothetical protein [uncultured Mycolicibacterium sp.]|uniref:hypothetical protein n=1 Tax=uncultured Mycolicibacterium sp. TaxID=2320817 RepID=UPI0032B1321B